MSKKYPLEFTLENETKVVIHHSGGSDYTFTLQHPNGTKSQFLYNAAETFTDEKEKELDFDQLNALRRFWLEQEKEELS